MSVLLRSLPNLTKHVHAFLYSLLHSKIRQIWESFAFAPDFLSHGSYLARENSQIDVALVVIVKPYYDVEIMQL